MLKYQKTALAFALLFFVFILSGCQLKVKDSLNWIDKKIGEGMEKIEKDKKGNGKEAVKSKEREGTARADDLSSEQKEAIDKWLKDNDLNRYGDSKNAIYRGGTPLLEPETGEKMNRYEYILKKFPNILERINSTK